MAQSHAPDSRVLLLSLTTRICSKITEHIEQQRQQQQSTKYTSLSSMSQLHSANPPPYTATLICQPSRRPRVDMASPHGPCLGEITWCDANHLPCRPPFRCCCSIDYAGFLLMRCIHSPGATRVILGNKIVLFLTQEPKPNPPKSRRYGHIRPILEPVFWKLSFFWHQGTRKRRSQTII